MKAFLLAAGMVVAGTSFASAEPWHRDRFPYEERHHAVCQEKAHRLWEYEHRAKADGHLSHREREIIRELEFDLDRTCGRYRWRG